MVTLDAVKAFAQNAGGSLSGAVVRLGSMKSMPRHLAALEDTGVRPATMSSRVSEKMKSLSMPSLSPSERRQAKLRLYGIADKA